MTVEEKKEVCAKALISWMVCEKEGHDMKEHNEEIANIFTSRMILKKFEVFDIDIVLPDSLLFILYVCVEGNPGQFQIVLKDLLDHIKERKGPIPKGYVITADDFSYCFMTDFPIIDIPKIYDKYLKLWDGQKYVDMNDENRNRYNACDTPKWWKEVME